MAGRNKSLGVNDVTEEVLKYISNKEGLALIEKAANYAMEHHAGQFRKSGEPYFIHLISVAYSLAELRVGPATIAAGYLHDVIEDCNVTHEELAKEFSEEIADLVEAVTKIGNLPYSKNDPQYQAENHRKIFIAMAKDVRVILIKLCDRLHNMRTLQYQSSASQKRIAAETLDVYAPIAHRLGISAIKNELEDLSFSYLNNEEYHHVAKLVANKKAERDEYVAHMIAEISEILSEHNIEFRIFGRSKHLYSIYNKMVKKNKHFDQILDLLAIRIITKTKQNCYEVLGYIHANYSPIPGRLKDYIAVPKTNMYQSIHTTVIGEDAKIFEIQIRTEEMDDVAEKGVAAHWRYKEGKRYNAKEEQKEIEAKLGWFKNFAAYSSEFADTANASEFMDTLQHDVFEANVYCMTPKGKVIDLPSGATPIDFAYRIHTDVGHTCVGALVNDSMVPLNTELKTGDVVEIRTRKNSTPSEDWLKIVKSNQARNKIKQFLAKKDYEEKQQKVDEGEKILAEEFRHRGFDPKDYMDKKKLENVIRELHTSNYVEFMYAIATKNMNPAHVVDKMTGENKNDGAVSGVLKHLLNRKVEHHNSASGVIVPGISQMKMSLARCCQPVYGDEIIGFITKGEGVKVHCKDCVNVKSPKARLINVRWDEEDKERTYETDITVECRDRSFLLTDIVTVVSQCQGSLETVNAAVNREELTCTVNMTVRLRDLDQLKNMLANIRKVDSVLYAERHMH